jgi:hypothetical protein
MRMTSDHLRVNFVNHVVNVEFTTLLGHAGKEGDLKK